MDNIAAQSIYLTLTDALTEPYRVPGVENAFADGTPCAKLYKEIYEANQRICSRLGQQDDDPDVELIINNLLSITNLLCLKMYHYAQITTAAEP